MKHEHERTSLHFAHDHDIALASPSNSINDQRSL